MHGVQYAIGGAGWISATAKDEAQALVKWDKDCCYGHTRREELPSNSDRIKNMRERVCLRNSISCADRFNDRSTQDGPFAYSRKRVRRSRWCPPSHGLPSQPLRIECWFGCIRQTQSKAVGQNAKELIDLGVRASQLPVFECQPLELRVYPTSRNVNNPQNNILLACPAQDPSLADQASVLPHT